MSRDDYTAEQALELLIAKLSEKDAELAAGVRAAVNEGRDIQQTEQVRKRGKKTKELSFRRVVPFSAPQALNVALDALNAHFVEQPLFRNSVLDDMAQSALGAVAPESAQSRSKEGAITPEGKGQEKAVEIELRTETQLLSDTHLGVPNQPDTFRIERVSTELIESQKANLLRLREFLTFDEEH